MAAHEIKRSIVRKVTEHTVLAAVSTLDCYGVAPSVTTALQADLLELEQLESSQVVDAAQSLVKIAIDHSITPTETTYADARSARDTLGDLLMDAKEIKG